MERYDRFISVVWVVLGIGQCVESWALGLGSVTEPGTGFMPFIMGIGMIVLAIALFIESFWGWRKKESLSKNIPLWRDVHWTRVVYITIIMLAYAVFLPRLGYLLDTFLLMVFLLKSGEPIGWPTAVIVGALTSGFSYLLFGVWLNVSFPPGILPFRGSKHGIADQPFSRIPSLSFSH